MSPLNLRRFHKTEIVHLGLATFWILVAAPAILFWKESILLVILMSLYANVEASVAAFLSAKSKPPRKRLKSTNLSHLVRSSGKYR